MKLTKEDLDKLDHGLKVAVYTIWSAWGLDPNSPTLKQDVERLQQDIGSLINGDPDKFGQQIKELRNRLKEGGE